MASLKVVKGVIYAMKCPHCKNEARSPEHGKPYQCRSCNWSSDLPSSKKNRSTNKRRWFKSMSYLGRLDRWFQKAVGNKIVPLRAIKEANRRKKNLVEKSSMDTKCEGCGKTLGAEVFLSKHPVCGGCTRKRHAEVTGKRVVKKPLKKSNSPSLGSKFKTTHIENTPYLSRKTRTINTPKGVFRVNQLRDVGASGRAGKGPSFRVYAHPREGRETITGAAQGHSEGKQVGRKLYRQVGMSRKSIRDIL